jgi:small subunit ribosomal protein S1
MTDAEKPLTEQPGQPKDQESEAVGEMPETPHKFKRYEAAWQSKAKSPAPEQAPSAEPKLGPIPNLTPEDVYGGGPKLRDLDADIETELKEALGGFSEKDLYNEPAKQPQQKSSAGPEQAMIRARVVALRGPDVFLDVPGERYQGLLPLQQFPEGPPAIGTEVEAQVEGFDQENGLLLLTRRGAAVHADWSSVAIGMTVEARVTGTNKGGLAVEVNGIRAFMPISQVDLYRVDDAEQFVKQKLRCMIVDVNPAEKNLVVSRRALLEKEREEAREKLWQELAEGQVREGIVRSVKEYGAFVDLGGVDGLLHVSEMSWSRTQKPSDLVQPGQTIKVVVLKLDREARKVGLGLKQLSASPWDAAARTYPPNSVVKGKVTRLMDFGAFVELEPGIEGLVHISELAPQRVHRAGDIVQPGQEVNVMVLNVDQQQRRISLSIKAALRKGETEPDEELEEEVETKPTRQRTTPLRGGLG